MESATLTSPQRRCSLVIPVQKSLSLPSYARAGGEGIDHRVIFAALEQKEKIRRKSKTFTRQNIFCLPLPSSSARCRETSLSSDTSCSSLEYQKPSPRTSRKEGPKIESESIEDLQKKHGLLSAEPLSGSSASSLKKSSLEYLKGISNEELTASLESSKKDGQLRDVVSNGSSITSVKKSSVENRLSVTAETYKKSSDSMERSSRSSSDSLSRKERRGAIKARVEAARKKMWNDSSSEDETRGTLTKYNSDGSIHKRGLKSKKHKRRSQDEVALKKLTRKQSLCLNLEQLKPEPFGVNNGSRDIKTDFCPSPSFPEIARKNYFSDFSNQERVSRMVQARIRHIEDEERKRHSSSNFRSPRQSPVFNSSSAPTEQRHEWEKQFIPADSPTPRSPQAPTPPPRSPKSMTFVNRIFMQHQSAKHNNENSIEGNMFIRPISSQSKLLDHLQPKGLSECNSSSLERRKVKEVMNSRRRTCGNFDFIEKNILEDLQNLGNSLKTSTSATSTNRNLSMTQLKEDKTDYSNEITRSRSDDRGNVWKSSFHENEQKKEFMFNSLENKKKSIPPVWIKRKITPPKNEVCLCRLITDNEGNCICSKKTSNKIKSFPDSFNNNYASSKEAPNFCKSYTQDVQNTNSKYPCVKSNVPITQHSYQNTSFNTYDYSDKSSASANLNSAMEELETVYQSLKVTSDSFSDKSEDCISKNLNAMQSPSKSVSMSRSSICGDSSNFDVCRRFGSHLENKSLFFKEQQCASPQTPSSPVKFVDLKTDRMCYDHKKMNTFSQNLKTEHAFSLDTDAPSDLFNDLMQHLDNLENTLSKNKNFQNPKQDILEASSDVSTFKVHILENTVSGETKDEPNHPSNATPNDLFNDLIQQLDSNLSQTTFKEKQPLDVNICRPSFKNSVNPVHNYEDKLSKKAEYEKSLSPELCNEIINKLPEMKKSIKPFPQVSARREFFDNLCKKSQQNSFGKDEKLDSSCKAEAVSRPKYKAMRSLSDNLFNLMTKNNVAEELCLNSKSKINVRESSPTVKTSEITNYKPNCSITNNIYSANTAQRDEICHVRVSMENLDSNLSVAYKNSVPRSYKALSSAVGLVQEELLSHPSTSSGSLKKNKNSNARLSAQLYPTSVTQKTSFESNALIRKNDSSSCSTDINAQHQTIFVAQPFSSNFNFQNEGENCSISSSISNTKSGFSVFQQFSNTETLESTNSSICSNSNAQSLPPQVKEVSSFHRAPSIDYKKKNMLSSDFQQDSDDYSKVCASHISALSCITNSNQLVDVNTKVNFTAGLQKESDNVLKTCSLLNSQSSTYSKRTETPSFQRAPSPVVREVSDSEQLQDRPTFARPDTSFFNAQYSTYLNKQDTVSSLRPQTTDSIETSEFQQNLSNPCSSHFNAPPPRKKQSLANDCQQFSQELSPCKPDILDETGLEKLLNSLLGDADQSSQTTASSGEMCVMQHLDVLRLKPVPS